MNDELKKMKEQIDKVQALIDFHSGKINKLPKRPNGMIKREARDTHYYEHHKNEHDKNFTLLRFFNAQLTNEQKRELRQYRKEQKQKSS